MKITTGGTQKETTIVELAPKQVNTLHYDLDYDFTKPETTLHDFVSSVKDMLARYEGNKTRIFEIEAELNDLEHYMEIGSFKNVPDGYKLYRSSRNSGERGVPVRTRTISSSRSMSTSTPRRC